MMPMATIQNQLLVTKLYVPTSPGTLIPRPRLHTLLDKALMHPLTLISAPAGFGKTTLLSTWAQALPASQARLCWLSLDEEDNDPRLFWTYVFSILSQHHPHHFHSLLTLLQAQPPAPLKSLLLALINLVTESQEHLLLILDDYQVITEGQVHTTLTYLLEHLPAQLHLILSTRADPPFSLVNLRARRHLLEVRTNQLRCTPEETRAFLQEVMGLPLPDQLLQEVSTRTEGWLVSLQLLGLSLPEHAHPASLLQELCGDQRYILDYLTQVVLKQQSQEVQTFLLSTSILERLSTSLCDAVMEQTGSQHMLEHLERANLFVVSLDHKRQWYRYHTLFAQALTHQLERTHPDLIPQLHARASHWYAQHEQTGQAILHALHAKEWEWTADLIEQKRIPLISETWAVSHHEITQLRNWLELLPVEVVHARPQLCLTSSLLLLMAASSPKLYGWLDVAETTLRAALGTQTDENDPSSMSMQKDLLGGLCSAHVPP